MRKILRWLGLALHRDLKRMETRARKAEAYASFVTEKAGKSGAIVAGGDGAIIEDVELRDGRTILIPIGVCNTLVRNVISSG